MKDITVLFLTVNKLPEYWVEYQKKVLLEAIDENQVISLSMKPINLGLNILQDKPRSLSNIYWQMLRGAKIATTDYIGIAEDDSLYIKDHFSYRPPLDTFAYNMDRWSLFNWGENIYSWRERRSNSSLIAPRLLLIKALEERFKKYPNGTPDKITGEVGRPRVERNMGITLRKAVDFYTVEPMININHDFASDHLQRSHRKRLGALRAYDIPRWGKASELIKHFK